MTENRRLTTGALVTGPTDRDALRFLLRAHPACSTMKPPVGGTTPATRVAYPVRSNAQFRNLIDGREPHGHTSGVLGT